MLAGGVLWLASERLDSAGRFVVLLRWYTRGLGRLGGSPTVRNRSEPSSPAAASSRQFRGVKRPGSTAVAREGAWVRGKAPSEEFRGRGMARRRFLGGAGSSVRRRKADRGGDGALGFWGGGGDWNGAQEVGDGLKKGKPGISGGVLARGLAGDLGRRSRRGVTHTRRVREEGEGADRWGPGAARRGERDAGRWDRGERQRRARATRCGVNGLRR